MNTPRVVALGGGHGLAASLQALRRLTDDITGVVTVADDGGSSGRLRDELDVLPPGDLRMALAALASDDEAGRFWERIVQHRFGGDGHLSGHAVGNLLLVALAEVLGDDIAALDAVGELLRARGRVRPMATVPLQIVAEVCGLDPADPGAGQEVRGQVAVATTRGRVVGVRLEPTDPPACQEAVTAVLEADWVVLGPGSWFTSVLPHVLVPDLAKALATTDARRLLALNLSPQRGETEGFSPEAHLDVFSAHAPELDIDIVLADESAAPDGAALARLRSVAGDLGAELVVVPVRRADGSPRHDPDLLATAYHRIFDGPNRH